MHPHKDSSPNFLKDIPFFFLLFICFYERVKTLYFQLLAEFGLCASGLLESDCGFC